MQNLKKADAFSADNIKGYHRGLAHLYIIEVGLLVKLIKKLR